MSEHGTRGMGFISETGESPQFKQHGPESTRSTKSESNAQDDEQQFIIQAPSLALPKGGGAIRGLGEKVNANPFTGTANISIPIYVTPGRQGFQPELSLSYGSGGGNGVFGMGWGFGIPSITRKTSQQLPKYHDEVDSDTFILAGAEDLVSKLDNNGNDEYEETADYIIRRYCPRVEQAFSLIERWTRKSDGDMHWRTINKDNITLIYGQSYQARISDPHNPKKIYSWLLEKQYDGKGNLIIYEYKAEDQAGTQQSFEDQRTATANRYIKRIKYSNQTPFESNGDCFFELVFDYGEHDQNTPSPVETKEWNYRKDAFSSYRAGFEIRSRRRCERVLMFHKFLGENNEQPFLVASTDITYNNYDDQHPYTLIQSVSHFGYIKKEDDSYLKESYPPLTFEYSTPAIGDQTKTLNISTMKNLPEGLTPGKYQLIDLDGVGVPGILTDQGGHWYFKEGLGEEGFAPVRPVETKPSPGTLGGVQQLQDLDGDGLPSLVQYAQPLSGYFERTEEANWKPFTPFKSQPNIDWQNPNLQMLDLNGDGFADVLISEDTRFIWYPSKGKEGYGEPRFWPRPQKEEEGPALVFNDITNSIYIADMVGDGLQDIVRIRNGNVCYWPNIGHGKFGPQRIMANAPLFEQPDVFNPARLKLADIDGTGTTDIIYFGSLQAHYWLNLAGNRFSAKQNIPVFPEVTNMHNVQVADIKANGTTCLVWSSPLPADINQPLKYIELMNKGKPYLLNAMTNNMGGRTEITYKPSTWFYLQDKKAGNPWQTRLSFPVHVVESIEQIDLITGSRYKNRYAYHHGYYDGIEREFRGFGMVEQWDIDGYSQNNELDQPPIYTKTWFHTGAWLQAQQLEVYYRKNEYYQGDADAWYLADTIIPDNLSFTEQREAVRVLKGSTLHQEVYALDNSDKQSHPYTVSEQNYRVIQLQEKNDQPYGVFSLQPLETISYHYERNPADPRISHQLNIVFDRYNNITESAAVAYPRRNIAGLTIYPEQQEIKLTYTSIDVRHKTHHEISAAEKQAQYDSSQVKCRHSVAVEQIQYELVRINHSAGNKLDSETIKTAFNNFTEKDFGNLTNAGQFKTLLSRVRHQFYADDGQTQLNWQSIDYLALPYQSYQQAFNSSQLTQAYDTKISLVDLQVLLQKKNQDGGGYHYWNNIWWQPSGFQVLDAAKFYQPTEVVDPFDNHTTIQYLYDFLPNQVTDPMGNRVHVDRYNLYNLQAEKITDPNNSHQEAAFDVLGQLVATAINGQEYDDNSNAFVDVGDNLKGFNPYLSIVETFTPPLINHGETDAVVANPLGNETRDFLKNATSRIYTDPWRFHREGKPLAVVTVTREQHSHENATPRLQTAILYQDGLGRELVSKLHIDPGDTIDLTHSQPDNIVRAHSNIRWLSSGRVIYNNKSKPVKQYEPYFSPNHLFDPEEYLKSADWGVSAILYYDPLDRVIKTTFPDGTIVRSKFTPWYVEQWDQIDSLKDNDSSWYQNQLATNDADKRRAANNAYQHAETPGIMHLDVLGREFRVIEDNGAVGKYVTVSTQNIIGNVISITDARHENTPIHALESSYDLLGNPLRNISVDSGDRRSLLNVVGNPIRQWDAKGAIIRTVYDALQRPTHVYSTVVPTAVNLSPNETLAQRIVYGDEVNVPDADKYHLRTIPWLQFDGAGLIKIHRMDFKGQPLLTGRRLHINPKAVPDWDSLKTEPADNVELTAAALLQKQKFTTRNKSDALARVTHMEYQHNKSDGAVLKVGEQAMSFNQAGQLLSTQAVDQNNNQTDFVQEITYNEKGQRSKVTYGNNVVTTYTYDKQTFRLINLNSTRPAKTLPTGEARKTEIQNIIYTYDAVGNIATIEDKTLATIYYAGAIVQPKSEYEYDAIYRLVKASGRENDHHNTSHGPYTSHNRVNNTDGQSLRNYTQNFTYDQVGNITLMKHEGVWQRSYEYAAVSNRLVKTINSNGGGTEENYTHDQNGNIIYMEHLKEMLWDVFDRLIICRRQVDGGSPEDGKAYYQYDNSGQRIRKLFEHGGYQDERIYLGSFEVYEQTVTSNNKVNELTYTLHVMDDQSRIAMIDTKLKKSDKNVNEVLIRYQIENHLQSVHLELNDKADSIAYEEYYPYGQTAYSEVSGIEVKACRYRYSGKEKDEESGLYYYGARYYAAWLGRWCGADPAGFVDGLNLYVFTKNNPCTLSDKDGRQTSAEIDQAEAIFEYLLNNAAFQAGENFGEVATGKDARKFGQAAHKMAEEVLDELKKAKIPGAERIVSEVRVNSKGIIVPGTGPSGAVKGSMVPDIILLKPGVDPASIVGKKASDVAEAVGDFKYGAGKIAKKYGKIADRLMTFKQTRLKGLKGTGGSALKRLGGNALGIIGDLIGPYFAWKEEQETGIIDPLRGTNPLPTDDYIVKGIDRFEHLPAGIYRLPSEKYLKQKMESGMDPIFDSGEAKYFIFKENDASEKPIYFDTDYNEVDPGEIFFYLNPHSA